MGETKPLGLAKTQTTYRLANTLSFCNAAKIRGASQEAHACSTVHMAQVCLNQILKSSTAMWCSSFHTSKGETLDHADECAQTVQLVYI